MSKAIRYNSNFFDRYAVAALRGTLSVGFASLHPRLLSYALTGHFTLIDYNTRLLSNVPSGHYSFQNIIKKPRRGGPKVAVGAAKRNPRYTASPINATA